MKVLVSELRKLISEELTRFAEVEAVYDEDLPGDKDPADMDEVAPPGWEKSVKAMKKHKDIKNPWALAWSMKKKGATPRT